MDARHRLQALLAFEVILYVLPSLMHRGWLIPGHVHAQAAIAETVIAVVLLLGLAATGFRPQSLRTAGLIVQAFALLGTLVGAAMIAIGVGPRSALDIGIHLVMLTTLIVGLIWFWRFQQPIR
jgi:hypothetical protein